MAIRLTVGWTTMTIRTSIAAALVATTAFVAPAAAETELGLNLFFPNQFCMARLSGLVQ